jgi:hypothetical protein
MSRKENLSLRKASRQTIVERFKKGEGEALSREAERIFQYYVLFGRDGLTGITHYLSELQTMKLTGLSNDDVDRLLNNILDDNNGYYAYKVGVVRETVDGVEIDEQLRQTLNRFLNFLKTE